MLDHESVTPDERCYVEYLDALEEQINEFSTSPQAGKTDNQIDLQSYAAHVFGA